MIKVCHHNMPLEHRCHECEAEQASIAAIPVLHGEELIILDELVTMQPVKREPLTKRRLLETYNQGGELLDPTHQDPEWWKSSLAPFQRVYSVGKTPELAIRALGKKVGWGRVHGFESQPTNDADMSPFETWYYRFWTGQGTSMKAAGRFVPGGVILDWWK